MRRKQGDARNRSETSVFFAAETRRALTEKQALDGSGLVSQRDVGHHRYFKRNSSFKSTIPFSLHLLFAPFSILPALVFLFIFPLRSLSFISSPFVRLVTFCQLSSHFAAPLHASQQRLRKARQAANSRFPPGGAVCSLTPTQRDREMRESLKD